MVDADKRRRSFAEGFREPLGHAPASPILAWAGWRKNLGGRFGMRGHVNAKALQTAIRRLRSGVVDAEVAFKLRHGRSGGREFGSGAGVVELLFECVCQGHQCIHLFHDSLLLGKGPGRSLPSKT
jgi:hypothetical protein